MRHGDRTHPLRECHGTTVKLARMLGARVAQTSIVAAHVALNKLAVEQQNAVVVNHLDNLRPGKLSNAGDRAGRQRRQSFRAAFPGQEAQWRESAVMCHDPYTTA